MGAGCYYTNKETGSKSFWFELPTDDNEEESLEFEYNFWSDYIKTILNDIGYIEIKDNEFINGLYSLYLESTYYGEGIIFRLEPNSEDHKLYNLGMANFEKNYRYIAKALLKDNLSLRIATSGYTSCEYVL